jgi:S-adenosylmethionine:tRNA ribosyltransferase-isomerase
VVNTSGTVNAALVGKDTTGDAFELHLSTRLPGNFWVVEVRRPGPVASLPCRDARVGTRFGLEGGGQIVLLAPYPLVGALRAPSRLWMAALQLPEAVSPYLERFGRPIRYGYVTRSYPGEMYQTVFATEPGSAEMPSAGRPFSPELVTRLVSCGIQIAPVLLHTGVASLEDHEPPYEEYFRVPAETADRIRAARRAGHRVVAVGTTVVRALETVTDRRGRTFPGEGWTNLVITAERPLRAVNAMITGFHEPHATHLAMVRQVIAAAGSQTPSSDLDRAYREAQEAGYLWHEFGDSHLILGGLQPASAIGSASSSSPGRV